MKNTYLFSFLVCLVTFVGYGQNENNHWILGTSDINFSVNPPTVNTVSNSGNYGKASISDTNGNLLFYTNGYKVWNKNHGLMQNGQLYTGSNMALNRELQPVVIVPHPANNGKYYIFCSVINDILSIPARSEVVYQYYIVDFTDSSYPLGKVVVPSNYELVYSENTGTGYFGPLTCVKKSTNDGYFVVMHLSPTPGSGGKLRCYEISNSGLNPTPIDTSLPNDIHYYYSNLEGEFQNNTTGIIKFSPDNLKFGELVITNRFHQGPNTFSNESRFYTMDFNNTTGVFSNFAVIEDSYSYSTGTNTDFEFSSDSNKAFLIKNSNIYVKDLTNLSASARKLSDTNNTNTFPLGTHLQRDKNDNILVSYDGSSFLHKIDNQDSYASSSINLNFISLTTVLSYGHTLPQLVPVLQPCYNDLTITSNVVSGTDKKQVLNTITASNVISGGAGAIYHAGNSVTLTNGFHAVSGSTFRAYIEGCTNNYVGRISDSEVDTKESILTRGDVKLYPNPNNGVFMLETGTEKDFNVSIYDTFGKLVFTTSGKENIFNLNVSNLTSGLYILYLKGDEVDKVLKFIKK